MPRLPAGGIGIRTARENGDLQECARELDAGPGCCRATNATGAWSDNRSPPHVQGSRLQYVSIVAIKGGKVPIDAGSLVTSCEHDKRFEESGDIAAFENTQALDQAKIHVMVEDIDRIFLADGHGTFVAFEEGCVDIVTRSYAAGKVVAVVCNDISGLVGAKDSAEPREVWVFVGTLECRWYLDGRTCTETATAGNASGSPARSDRTSAGSADETTYDT